MSKNTSINLRVNSEVKEEAEKILAEMGLTLSESFNMLLYQINLKKALPFKIDTKSNYTIRDLKYEIKENIEKYENGNLEVNGPFSNLDDLWDSMEI